MRYNWWNVNPFNVRVLCIFHLSEFLHMNDVIRQPTPIRRIFFAYKNSLHEIFEELTCLICFALGALNIAYSWGDRNFIIFNIYKFFTVQQSSSCVLYFIFGLVLRCKYMRSSTQSYVRTALLMFLFLLLSQLGGMLFFNFLPFSFSLLASLATFRVLKKSWKGEPCFIFLW